MIRVDLWVNYGSFYACLDGFIKSSLDERIKIIVTQSECIMQTGVDCMYLSMRVN